MGGNLGGHVAGHTVNFKSPLLEFVLRGCSRTESKIISRFVIFETVDYYTMSTDDPVLTEFLWTHLRITPERRRAVSGWGFEMYEMDETVTSPPPRIPPPAVPLPTSSPNSPVVRPLPAVANMAPPGDLGMILMMLRV